MQSRWLGDVYKRQQELAREANTCAAKISDGAHTETVVALKVVVEQLREQVQNVA